MVRLVEQAESKTCKCHNCKAKLEYGYHDIVKSVERDYGGGSDTVYRITCPSCGSKPSVSAW